jgi:hypothetical protein
MVKDKDDLIGEMTDGLDKLDRAIKELNKHGVELAQAECDYKMELTKEVLLLRDQGNAVTIINLIIHGRPVVAKKRLERDIAKSIYEANQEYINVMKLKVKIIESQIQREYYS